MSSIHSGTAQGIMDFFDYLMDERQVEGETITSLRIVIRKVLISIEGENSWNEVDVLNLDIADVFERFTIKTRGRYTSDSIKTYRSRFTRAITWYSKFLTEPEWTPPQKKPRIRALRAAGRVGKQESFTSRLITYPFPLRPGMLESLELPADLTPDEAQRIRTYISTLIVDVVGEPAPS